MPVHVFGNICKIDKILKIAKKSSKFKPIKLIEDLTWDEFAKLNANVHNLQGIYPSVDYKRYYPDKESIAHIVGYISSNMNKSFDCIIFSKNINWIIRSYTSSIE